MADKPRGNSENRCFGCIEESSFRTGGMFSIIFYVEPNLTGYEPSKGN